MKRSKSCVGEDLNVLWNILLYPLRHFTMTYNLNENVYDVYWKEIMTNFVCIQHYPVFPSQMLRIILMGKIVRWFSKWFEFAECHVSIGQININF